MEKRASGPTPANPPAASPTAPPGRASEETAPPHAGPPSAETQPPPAGGQTAPPAAAPGDLQSTQAFEGKTTPNAADAGAHPPPAKHKLTRLGDFQLVHKLGEGGMGAVFKARQISLDREAAVKVLHRHLAADPSFVQRFLREARIMARLEHPNTVRCLFVGEEHGFHYFAMEFIDGGSLESWMKRLGRLEVGDALHVILACAHALQEAHDQGVVHRDMKPDNVLLTRKGVVKVADLGLAKATRGEDVSLTRTGTGAGTPVYMAPEQFRDVKRVEPRSDIYSLGCMLYYFLTGNPPFQGETYVELLEAKEKGQYPPARRSNDGVPPRLDLIIDKMLAKAPEVRYQSCAELIADLQGLGLAGTALSFLEAEAGPAPAARGAAAKPTVKPVAQSPTRVAPHPLKPPARKAPEAAPEPEEAEFWYLCFTASDGRVVTRKMTISQVREFIRSRSFDENTQACRTLQGNYRALGTYPEFAHILQSMETKAKADRKAASFQNLYQNLDREEARRRRRRWLYHLYLSVGGWVKLLIYLAFLAAAGVGLYFLLMWGLHWLRSKGQQFKNYERPPETRRVR